MGSDPFEEFEFKPLTEGLGFHPKKSAHSEIKPTAPKNKTMVENRGFDFLDEEQGLLKPALPRAEFKKNMPAAQPTQSPSAVDEILQTLQKNRKLEIEIDRRHRTELKNTKNTVETWKTAAPRVSPMLLDGLLITAASLLCMIAMLIITKVDLLANLSNPDTEGMIYLATFVLFAGVASIYQITHRVFLGYTPGEWAYDLRLGHAKDVNTAMYAGKVLARQALIVVTGGILLPLAGLIAGRDFAGMMTGMTLMRRA